MWFTKFGLTENPFTTDPFQSDYTMVNYSSLVEELIYNVRAGHMFLLVGKEGAGKTTMLLQVINTFGGKGRVLYVDGSTYKNDLDIEQVLKEKGTSFLRKVRGKKPKSLIVLLDNAEHINGINMQKLKYYFDQDYIHSVVFSTANMDDLSLPASIMDRIGNNVREIPPMINYDALRIVRDRFADHFFLPDDIILKLFEMSDKNVKTLLQNCEKVCSFVVKEGKGEVLSKYLRMALHVPARKKESMKNRTVVAKTAVMGE